MRFGIAHHEPDVVRERGDAGEVDGAVLRWEDHSVLRRERLRRDPSTVRLDVRYAHGEKRRAAALRMTEGTDAVRLHSPQAGLPGKEHRDAEYAKGRRYKDAGRWIVVIPSMEKR